VLANAMKPSYPADETECQRPNSDRAARRGDLHLRGDLHVGQRHRTLRERQGDRRGCDDAGRLPDRPPDLRRNAGRGRDPRAAFNIARGGSRPRHEKPYRDRFIGGGAIGSMRGPPGAVPLTLSHPRSARQRRMRNEPARPSRSYTSGGRNEFATGAVIAS